MICTHSQRPCFVVLSLFYERGGGENGSNQWLKKVFFPNRCVDGSKMYILLRRTTFFFLDNSKKYSMLFFFQLRTPTFFLENTDRRGCEICVCARICDVFLSWHHCLFFDWKCRRCGSVRPGGWYFLSFFFVIVWRRRAEETGYIR